MLELIVTAMASGSGKTMITCGLLKMLLNKGFDPCAFKCGPDYIDPMFHRSVLGTASHNLDLFLMREDEVALKAHYGRYRAGHGAIVTEGVMGYYDGLGGTTERGSAFSVGRALGLPALLVVSPGGSSLTLAAQIRGMLGFRENSGIRAVIFNRCSEGTYRMLAPVIERETGLPSVGYLPSMEEAVIESRHLGLYTAGEITDLAARLETVATQMEKTVDLEKLCGLFSSDRAEKESQFRQGIATGISGDIDLSCAENDRVRIALAEDEAFCFIYDEMKDLLYDLGAQPVPFSPVHDKNIPAGCGGMILSGGYPELYAKELSENTEMRNSVRKALKQGMPCIAECGGMMYLQKAMEGTDGQIRPMAGYLGGTATRKPRLVRFGYSELTADEDSLLFRKGEKIPIHEFHYYDTTDNGESLRSVKPLTGRNWRCCHADGHLYAGFPHLYLPGSPKAAARFVAACRAHMKTNAD